jgi:hypothetical protein
MAKTRAKPRATFEVQVNGLAWNCRIWRPKPYVKMHGDNSTAITVPGERIIDFRTDEFNQEVVGHELTHAFFKYLHLDSVHSPAIEDIEEIVASWLGANYIQFYEKSNAIYSAFKGVK